MLYLRPGYCPRKTSVPYTVQLNDRSWACNDQPLVGSARGHTVKNSVWIEKAGPIRSRGYEPTPNASTNQYQLKVDSTAIALRRLLYFFKAPMVSSAWLPYVYQVLCFACPGSYTAMLITKRTVFNLGGCDDRW